MAKLRRDTFSSTNANSNPTGPTISPGTAYIPEFAKSLRVVASGTLFVMHTLFVPNHPAASSAVRAHAVEKSRGGSANTMLSLLAQFPAVEAVLVAPLGGNDEGRRILHDLENEGVITQYCKIWPGAGVPTAWVLHSVEDNTRTVINHNPLPDITHEDFVSLLGPLLAPENYPDNYAQLQQQQFYQQHPHLIQPHPTHPSGALNGRPVSSNRPNLSPRPVTSASGGAGGASSPRPSQSSGRPVLSNPNSPAPFDWLHFEGRSVKTTLNNMVGLDGLARERKWRSHCVFSVDVGRKARQGVEALIPHADVLFLNKQYAQAHSPHYASTPRTFLLSLTSLVPPHALLVAYWGKDGAAVLSLPTREYFQSSCWVEERPPPASPLPAGMDGHPGDRSVEMRSVRSGSDFWADGGSRTPSSSAYTLPQQSARYLEGDSEDIQISTPSRHAHTDSRVNSMGNMEGDDYDEGASQDTERGASEIAGVVDEVGAHEAFIAGMIYALSRRVCPGAPYTPSAGGREESGGKAGNDDLRARWRLDECLRFATELSGRKARRKTWDGLAEEMVGAGWFNI